MQKRTQARLANRLFLNRDIQRIKRQVAALRGLLTRRPSAAAVEDFDNVTERLLSEIYGNASDEAEAYEYAKLGEAGSLVNLQEEAQEGGARDIERESLQQRRQVLESCLAGLEATYAKRSKGGLSDACVADYMSHDVRSVHKDASLKEAGRLLTKWKVGSLLVDDGRRYVGIITDTDLSRKAVGKGLDPNTTAIKACMSKPVLTIEDTEALTDAIAMMKANRVRHLAVTEDQTIIGVLSVSDVLRAYAELAGLDAEPADGG